jgi:hypothetical protein
MVQTMALTWVANRRAATWHWTDSAVNVQSRTLDRRLGSAGEDLDERSLSSTVTARSINWPMLKLRICTDAALPTD